MRRISILLGLLVCGLYNAQTDEKLRGRIGINTLTPRASLEIKRHEEIPQDRVQGFLVPHLTQVQRNAMTKEDLPIGLQIFNTDKKCLDWWNGKTWQCTDGTLMDTHGESAPVLIERTSEHTETRNFNRNNCPEGYWGSELISYTGTGVGTGISVNATEALNKARENARNHYTRLGQDYANTNGQCRQIPLANIDPQIKLGSTKHWFSSIYDNDYLSANGEVIMPHTQASWDNQAPVGDGIIESKILDVQGTIPTQENAIEIAIPVLTGPGVRTNLPSFTTYLEIPASYTENGKQGILVFTWQTTEIKPTTFYFRATIYAKDTPIPLKKLDLTKGMGKDHMGLSLGVVKYPTSLADRSPEEWQGELDIRLISAIPDRRFSATTTIGTDTQKRHQFFYVPAMGPEGKIWLGNNLGADYANIHHEKFSPAQQAKNPQDYHAYGSLGQWGRIFDGHELMNWTSSTQGTPVITEAPYYWTRDNSRELTEFNENCPLGWHTPSNNEQVILANSVSKEFVNIQEKGFKSGHLHIPLAGRRQNYSGSIFFETGIKSYLWSNTYDSNIGIGAYSMVGNINGQSASHGSNRSFGFGIRCIKDN